MKRMVATLWRSLLCAAIAALPLQAAAARVPHPVKVLACNPSRGTTYAPGYVAGYYPAGPYYWPDVYGQRFYQMPVRSNPVLGIDYVNATSQTIEAIQFGLVAKGTLVAEVRDVGTFSPGIEIKHMFGLSPNVFPLGTGLARCIPLHIRFADGTTWKNPHLPALQRSIYRHP